MNHQRKIAIELHKSLAAILEQIEINDQNYEVRYSLMLRAMSVAQSLGYSSGIRIDPLEPDWPVCYIELPTGQVSWHVPKHKKEWDGHDKITKFARINQFIEKTKKLE